MMRSTVSASPRHGFAALLTLIVALILSAPVAASPTHQIAAICDHVAAEAASRSTVPLSVLRAISRTETGRTVDGRFVPWPWTVNHAGDGHWFESREQALSYVRRARADGATNLDMGCFQINFRWHGHAFPSLDAMMDPAINARYAAEFLTALHAELGGWDDAVAAFHSRTPRYAERYMARYHRIHAALEMPAVAATGAPPRANAPAGIPRALDLSARAGLTSGAGALRGAAVPFLTARPARPLWGAPP